jgi:hypothetical protein
VNINNITHNIVQIIGQNPQTSNLFVRKYDRDIFRDILKEMVIPLFGAQHIYKRIFFQEEHNVSDSIWINDWKTGHNRTLLSKYFPTLIIGDNNRNQENESESSNK